MKGLLRGAFGETASYYSFLLEIAAPSFDKEVNGLQFFLFGTPAYLLFLPFNSSLLPT